MIKNIHKKLSDANSFFREFIVGLSKSLFFLSTFFLTISAANTYHVDIVMKEALDDTIFIGETNQSFRLLPGEFDNYSWLSPDGYYYDSSFKEIIIDSTDRKTGKWNFLILELQSDTNSFTLVFKGFPAPPDNFIAKD